MTPRFWSGRRSPGALARAKECRVPPQLGVALGALSLLSASCAATRYSTEPGHAALVAPARIAEGDTGKAKAAEKPEGKPNQAVAPSTSADSASQAKADAAPAGPPAHGYPPDPSPLQSTQHYEYELQYDRGNLSVMNVRPFQTTKPMETARMMGRFAVELWLGPELIERVRFDFPLMGAEAPPGDVAPLHSPPSFGEGSVLTRKVVVPATERATSARLIDRATGEELELSWPPQAPTSVPSAAATPKP